MGECFLVRRGGNNIFPTKITITTAPTKTSYIAGESFSSTGIVVQATYSNNTTKDVTSECTF